MLTLLFACITILPFNVREAEATTIIVPDNYPTIQQAVDAAKSGDTVLVRAGVYTENVLIYSKSISLIGEGASNPTIRGVYAAG